MHFTENFEISLVVCVVVLKAIERDRERERYKRMC